VYIPLEDLKESCENGRDFYNNIEVSVNDVTYITPGELLALINAFSEYKEYILNNLRG